MVENIKMFRGQQFDLLSEILRKTYFEEHIRTWLFYDYGFALHFLTIKSIYFKELVKYSVNIFKYI